jgi:chemotaxis protein CheX
MTPSSDDITEIAREVWSAMLGLETEVAATETLDSGSLFTGTVTITGAADSVVSIQTTDVGARAYAAAMFGSAADEVADDEVVDAIGELTNMVGGNIKSLLPEPSRLSLPAVAQGQKQHLYVPGAEVLNQVALSSEGEHVLITVWSRPIPENATQESDQS